MSEAARAFAHALPPGKHQDSQEALRFARWFGEERAAAELRPVDIESYVESFGVYAPNASARAESTLLTITNDTDERGDVIHHEGGYEDTFEKTPDGWRFKSRIHVWPEIEWTDRPEDMPPRNLADE